MVRRLSVFALLGLIAGCASMQQVRIDNLTGLVMKEVTLGGTSFEEIAAGELSPFYDTSKTLGYASLRMTIKGQVFTGQTLYFGSDPVTYRIRMKDFYKHHLDIELVKVDKD